MRCYSKHSLRPGDTALHGDFLRQVPSLAVNPRSCVLSSAASKRSHAGHDVTTARFGADFSVTERKTVNIEGIDTPGSALCWRGFAVEQRNEQDQCHRPHAGRNSQKDRSNWSPDFRFDLLGGLTHPLEAVLNEPKSPL